MNQAVKHLQALSHMSPAATLETVSTEVLDQKMFREGMIMLPKIKQV